MFLENIKMGNQDILEQGLKIGGLSLKNVIARLYLKYGENMYFDITEKGRNFGNTWREHG